MPIPSIEALQAERAVVLSLCESFDDGTWKAPSGCAGWSVQDVISHIGALFWLVVDPSSLPSVEGLPTEAAQEVYIEGRRWMGPAEVLTDYTSVSEQAIAALEGLVGAGFDLPLGDLGTYDTSMLPNIFTYDHFIHTRHDLFGPRGPLAGPAPEVDDLRAAAILAWVEAALPQQNADILPGLGGPLALAVSGPAGRTLTFGGDGPPVATVESDLDGLLRWITHRGTWADVGATATGSADALALARTLKVF